MTPYLIAEIGINHDGSLERAASMIRAAARAGFDAVKFQHWVMAELLAAEAPTAGYQGDGDQRALLDGLVFDVAALRSLSEVARREGVDYIVTADGVLALDDVLQVRVDALKIGSGDADNPFLLKAAAATGQPLVVSLGMTEDIEVAPIVDLLVDVEQLTLLHCVSAYPTPVSEARLGRIPWLRETTGRAVGFSDHTIGLTAAVAAVAVGAVTVEKHVTWSRTAPGPDHAMSLDLAVAQSWVAGLRDAAAGLDPTVRSPDEDANKVVIRKALYLRRRLEAGDVLAAADLVPLRPVSDGIPALQADVLVGKRLVRCLEGGSILRWRDVTL